MYLTPQIVYSPNSNIYLKTLERTIKSTFGFIICVFISITTFFLIICSIELFFFLDFNYFLYRDSKLLLFSFVILILFSVPYLVFIYAYSYYWKEVKEMIKYAKLVERDIIKKYKMYTSF